MFVCTVFIYPRDTLIEPGEIVLKNNIFEFDEKTFKQVRGIAIGTRFAPSYAILFMADLEEKILNAFEEKPMIWWRYIDDIFFIWEHGEESLEKFLNKLNSFHPTIKFTAEYSKETINFLDVNIRLVEGELMTDFFLPIARKQYHIVKLLGSIEFVLTTKVLINAATI